MAISKHRKSHKEKVDKAYEALVAARLADGQSRTGQYSKPKPRSKDFIHHNPERVSRPKGKSGHRAAKIARLAARSANV